MRKRPDWGGVDHHVKSSRVSGGVGQGQLASGGIEDKIEATFPPVLSPKIVPRS